MGSIPGRGTKIPRAAQRGKKKKSGLSEPLLMPSQVMFSRVKPMEAF